MADINKTSGIDLQSLGLQKPQDSKKKNELGSEDFMKLLIAQMTNSDPLNPSDPTEFVSQLTSIGTVSGIQELKDAFNGLSNELQSSQALQASALVGKSVHVPSEGAVIAAGEKVLGSIDLTVSTPDLHLKIFNEQGELVRTINKGAQAAGDIPFEWDGLTDAGAQAAAGPYKIVAEGLIDGANQQLNTYVAANVDSVTLNKGNGLILNLAGLGSVSFDLVKEISE